MSPRLVGARVPRVNDGPFLHGTGRFLDDVEVPGLLHAAILRSPVAHGVLRGLDRSGLDVAVEVVLGPEEVRARAPGEMPVLWEFPGQRQRGHPLVDGRVRYVGEPVGVVVASSRYQAEDAADRVFVDVEELPAVSDPERAAEPEAPLLYPPWGSNVVAEIEAGDGSERTEAVFATAERRLSARFRIGRMAVAPMEPRGVVAIPEPGTGRLTVYTSSQAPHMARDMIAAVLGLPKARLRVVAPDVGGGFGLKDHIGEDEILVCLAALELGRPVAWAEDRRESLMASTQARGQVHEVEVAFDADGTLRGIRVDGLRDCGASLSLFGAGPLFITGGNLPGPYRWEAVRATGRAVVTNTPPTGAYRGFGQPQAVFLRERMIDMVAASLEMDPVEIRLRNMIGPEELPHTTRTSLTFESGDYPGALCRAARLVGSGPEPPDDGRARGVGFCSYVELSGVGPSEGNRAIGVSIGGWEEARVTMEADGSVVAVVGTSPHGQGHETTFAQLCADALGVPVEAVRLLHSDTDIAPYSAYGTAASRSITVAGGAVVRASEQLAAKVRRIAGEILEASPDDVVLADSRASVVGTGLSLPIPEVAAAALRGQGLPEGMEPGLTETFVHEPAGLSYSYASHACRVAVDRETGHVEVERFVVVHDCGTIVNPTIVEGQIHGGVAQGIGEALLEETAYSEEGVPLTTTFLDYLIPVSSTVPDIEIEHTEHPSPFVPGGMKGMGEGGTIGAPAAVLNAVAAALPEIASKLTEIPLTPSRLWELLQG